MEALAAPVLELCEISDVLVQAHLLGGRIPPSERRVAT
jgi:hypothetical protein